MQSCLALLRTEQYAHKFSNLSNRHVKEGDPCPYPATHGPHCYVHSRDYDARWSRLDSLAGRVG